MTLQKLTRSAALAAVLAWLVTFLPAMRAIQSVDAAGVAPLPVQTPAAQINVQGCSGPGAIIQGCPFSGAPLNLASVNAWTALEQQAVADLLRVHQLPATDRDRVLGWERSALRALIFDKLLAIVKKDPAQRTDPEKQIYSDLAAFVQAKRLDAANFARAEYTRWANNPCAYAAPPNFSYSISSSCATPIGGLFGGPQPPSLEEFQNYGTAHVSSQYQTDPALQAVTGETTKALGLAGGAGLAVGAGVVAGFIGANLAAGSTIIAAIHPFLVAAIAGTNSSTAALATASTTAAGVTGGVTFASVAAIVVVAITIAVIQGINVFTAAAIPGKLDEAVAAARITPDLGQMVSSDSGLRELYSYFLMATMPDYPATGGVPAPQTSDPKFEVDPGPLAQVSATLGYQGWDGLMRVVRLSDGWFVDSANGASRLTLGIDYLDWNGKGWTAWRIGNQFLHTRTGDAAATPFMSDSIKFKTPAGTNRTAKVKAPDRTVPTANPVLSSPANAAGWHNVPVTVTWNWSDNAGGDGLDAATCPTTTAIAPGSTVLVTCKDLAGNTGSASASAKIDTAAPVFSGLPAVNPPPNAAGWNNTDVTVNFTCNDGDLPGVILLDGTVSGIASCGPTRTLASEGPNQSVVGTAVDVAGNSATQTKDGINIDKTAPVVTRNSAADGCSLPGTNGWCRGTQTAGFQASDALSGLATPAQASFTPSSATEGAVVMIASGAVQDVAGNSNPGVSAGPFKIDATAPRFPTPPTNQTVNATGPAGATVTYAATASDNLDTSPAVTCSKASGSSFPIGATTVSCTATDQAGNQTMVSFTVTVKSASAQLTDLQSAVTGVGPGASLANNLQAVQTAVQAGAMATACSGLRDFLNEVRAQDGKKLTAAQAQQFTADATRIIAVLVCRSM